jgi:hypothetical protein
MKTSSKIALGIFTVIFGGLTAYLVTVLVNVPMVLNAQGLLLCVTFIVGLIAIAFTTAFTLGLCGVTNE